MFVEVKEIKLVDTNLNLKPKRTLVLGDQHGAYKAVQQVLGASGFNLETDLIINLGDVVDGWPHSAELVQFWIDLEKKCSFKPIFLRGNHDDWAWEWIQTGIKKDMWINQGGQSTYDSYQKCRHFDFDAHYNFFKYLHHYYIDDQNRLFLHAGFTSHRGVKDEIHKPNFWWDRTLWESAVAAKRVKDPLHIPKRFKNYKEIYIGHTTTVNWDYKKNWDENGKLGTKIVTPMNSHNVWNLDTGCGFAGKLTIMDINSKEYWQSDFVNTLYPNVKGRGKFKRNWKK